jgi:hypothetical protein
MAGLSADNPECATSIWQVVISQHPIFSPEKKIEEKWATGERRHNAHRYFRGRHNRPGDRIGQGEKHASD